MFGAATNTLLHTSCWETQGSELGQIKEANAVGCVQGSACRAVGKAVGSWQHVPRTYEW